MIAASINFHDVNEEYEPVQAHNNFEFKESVEVNNIALRLDMICYYTDYVQTPQ